MESTKSAVQQRSADAKAGQSQSNAKDGLEPCTKPQSEEALRFNEEDEACNDGVN